MKRKSLYKRVLNKLSNICFDITYDIKKYISVWFNLDCGKCFYSLGGYCPFKGETMNGYWCFHFRRSIGDI